MYAQRQNEKVYLNDQPLIERAIRVWVETLDLSNDFGTEATLDTLECKSRDGFWAASHNCGGFDYYNLKEFTRPDDASEDYEDDAVYFGVRAMYEGIHLGVHTLCVYASQSNCEYSGAFGKNSLTLATYEIRFKTASGLRRQLRALTNKLNKALRE